MADDETELAKRITTFLDRHTVMTLATLDRERPHAASLMYAREGFTLYWLSDPKVRHSRHVEPATIVSVTVAGQYDDFREIQGLQMQGHAGKVQNDEEEHQAFELLKFRYPFLKAFGRGMLARQLGAAAVYAFRPSTITLIDNTRGFGFKETMER